MGETYSCGEDVLVFFRLCQVFLCAALFSALYRCGQLWRVAMPRVGPMRWNRC